MKDYNGHKIYEPSDPHPKWHRGDASCLICDGGLSICSVCGKAEVELGQPCNVKTIKEEAVDSKLKVYRDAWRRLYEEVLDEKTGWGKEELKKRMDKMLIEEMEKYLGASTTV